MKKELIQLVSRIMGFKAISFDGNHVFLLKVPMILIPYKTLAQFQHLLIERYGFSDVYSIIFGLGSIQGYNGTSIYIKNYRILPNEKDLLFFLEQTKLVGLGNITLQLADIKGKHAILSYYNSPEAIKYTEMYGVQKFPVDFYQLGLIAGSTQAICNGGDIVGLEKKCLAKGDDRCLIEVRDRKDWSSEEEYEKDLPKKIKEIEELKKLETIKSLLEPVKIEKAEMSNLMKFLSNKYKNRVFSFSDKGIHLFDINGMITPIEILSLLAYTTIRKFGDGVTKIFYEVGKEEGKELISQIKEKVTFREDFSSLSMAFESIGLVGLGSVEIIRSDMKNKNFILKVKDNYLARKYLKFFGIQKKGIDYYLSGILAGIATGLLNENMDAFEDKCLVQGSPYCVFEIEKIK